MRVTIFCLIFVTLFLSLVVLLQKNYKVDLKDGEKGKLGSCFSCFDKKEKPVEDLTPKPEQNAPTSRELLDDDSEVQDGPDLELFEWKHETNRIWKNELGAKQEDSLVDIDEGHEEGQKKHFAKSTPVALEKKITMLVKKKTMLEKKKTVRFDGEDKEEEVFEVIGGGMINKS